MAKLIPNPLIRGYYSWQSMKARCNGKNKDNAHIYAGLEYPAKWETFEGFLDDMGERPVGNYSLERKDNSKGYSKDNCVWATVLEQNHNKTNNVVIEHAGIKLDITQWAERLGIARQTLFARYYRNPKQSAAQLLRPARFKRA